MTVQSSGGVSHSAAPLSNNSPVGLPPATQGSRFSASVPVRSPIPVSVVVPFYNGHRTIQRVLDSIDAQSVRPSEVVLVDDGSRVPLREADLSCQVDLRIVRHRTNVGIPAARNAGIRSASNDWVAFLDHDDEWMPGKLERQWDLLQAQPDPETVVFYGRCVWLEPAEGKALLFPGPGSVDVLREGGEAGLKRLLRQGLAVPFITLLMHRDIFARHGYLDERIRGGSDDYELVLRLASLGVRFATSDFDVRDRYSAIYHMGTGNHSRNPGFLEEECIFLQRMALRSPALEPLVKRALARSYYRAGRIHERLSQKEVAREHYRTSLRYHELAPATWLAMLGLPLAGRSRRVLEGAWRGAREVRERAAGVAYAAQRWLHRA